MEAQSVAELPTGEDWQYEPYWQGFRCIVFRDGDRIELQSKSGQTLNGDFPDVVENIRAMGARKFVLDGEIVVPRLVTASPAVFIAFDLLVTERATVLVNRKLVERRGRLETFADRHFSAAGGVRLSPATHDVDVARKWLTGAQRGIDGVMAKELESVYHSGQRIGMRKVKSLGTAH
jgi:ATP-dependent DNA ligase